VLSAFGVRGDFKIEPLAPDQILAAGRAVCIGQEQYAIERSRRRAGFLYLKLAGINDREHALKERGRYLQAPESSLGPPGEDTFYHYQLIGLRVVTTSGEELGEITDIITTGANEVFVARGKRGELLIPAIEDVVRQVDVEDGRLLIEPIPGLLPE
jgi:16S rRNA processing protein RimM